MSLADETFLFLDCQTTGMRPSTGHLLELAWGWGWASQEELACLHGRLLQLPEGHSLPARISEITGLREEDLRAGLGPASVRQEFLQDFQAHKANDYVVIHYAQFERPFLESLCAEPLPFRILCTSKIAKKLLPQLPSRNIRALAGYFGRQVGELKRAGSHVQGTFDIWKGLVGLLERQGLTTPLQIEEWLQAPPAGKSAKRPASVRYEYRIGKDLRLALPDQPGVYRMLARNGQVLYVGKATSLKDRVNSYFRGKKGRDPRKLEMLTQVWNLDVTPCDSPLEAALLENDEIKRFDPPYNVSLKTGRRSLVFYSRDFESASSSQGTGHRWGPFRPMNSIEQLRLLRQAAATGDFDGVFYVEMDPADLAEGFRLYVARSGLDLNRMKSLRSFLAWGLWHLRLKKRTEGSLPPSEDPDTAPLEESADPSTSGEEVHEERPPTPQEISEKFGRVFLRAAAEYHRSRHLTRLLNSEIRWQMGDRWHSLSIVDGRPVADPAPPPRSLDLTPWKKLSLADFDRMSVLLSELAKHPHIIEHKPYRGPLQPAGQ